MNPITIVVADTQYHKLTQLAIERTIKCLPMDAKVLTFSNKPIYPGETLIKINEMNNRLDYNEIILKHLWPFIDTEHYLIVQYDGFAINKESWLDDFLSVDYIGAPWKGKSYSYPNSLDHRVGNGGFCLRSKKLLDATRDPEISINFKNKNGAEEDRIICDYNRNLLESKYNIKFAPYDLSNKFSYELGPVKIDNPFGMHGIWNVPLYLDEEESLEYCKSINRWNGNALKNAIENAKIRNFNMVYSYLNDFLKE